ncbi:MAG: hypothetical protein WCF57_08545 [Pyrinomonadaceae bacterium]
MAQTYPLDTVIRIVDQNTKATPPAEKIVIIDINKRKVAAASIFNSFREIKYILVSNNIDSRKVAESRASAIAVTDFSTNRTVSLNVSYLASCEAGNEERVAEALFDGPHPGAVLNSLIARWVKDFVNFRSAAELIDNYYNGQKGELEANLTARALAEVGLSLQVKLSLIGEPLRDLVTLGPIHFPVRVKDYASEQDLKLTAELQINEAHRINAVLSQSRNITPDALCKEETRRHFAEHVSLQKFHNELNQDGVKTGLIQHLNGKLSAIGRQVRFISLEGQVGGGAQVFYEAKHDIPYEIQEYPEPVIIKNSIQMMLCDVAKYLNTGAQNLDTWVKERLEQIIHQVLFGKKYIDLLLRFEPLELEIKERISREAEAIGYTIKQLITIPDLPPYTWLNNFLVEAQGAFETKLSKFEVKLNIIVTAKIKRLGDIEHLLNSRQDVPGLMKAAILSETRQFLHKIDPERFYMRFSFTDKPKEQSIEEALTSRIKARLTGEFHAEVVDVIPKIVDTEITKRFYELQKNLNDFQIELLSPNPADIKPVVFTGKFKVEAVHYNGWYKFQSISTDLAGIRKALEDFLTAEMSTLPHNILKYNNYADQKILEETVARLAARYTVEEFGLVIKLNTVQRELTYFEMKNKDIIHGIAEQVIARKQELTEAVASGLREDKIQDLKEIIRKLEEMIPAGVSTSASSVASLPEAQTYAPTSLVDFGKPKKMLKGSQPNGENGNNGEQE